MHDGPLDLRLLAALDALVKRGSVSRAAEDLGVSQPTMSRTLARLREALNDEVLVRTGAKMIPTDRAREVAEAARRAFEDLENAIAGDGFDPRTSTRHFRVAAWDYTQRVLLGPLVAAVRRDAPGVSIEVVPVLARSPIDVLDAGEIDISIGLHRQTRDGYYRCSLFSDRFVLCARPDHPLWDEPVTPERFAAAAHLLVAPFGATQRGAVDIALQALGLSRRVATFVPNFASAPDLLRDTDLIATLPARVAVGGLRCEDPPIPLPEFEVEAVWHARTHNDEGHRWFRGLLRAAAAPV